jgi:predicted DNA-binding protein
MTAQPVNVKQVNVYLTHEQHAKLLKLKEKTGAPVSEIIRRAIDQYLKAGDSKR